MATIRPEDRSGLRAESLFLPLNSSILGSIADACHALPNFRGKVRAADMAMKFLKLENHHMLKTVSIDSPVTYLALLDFHSRHERWAYFMNEYEKDTTRFLVRLFTGEGCFIDVGANIGLIALPFSKLVAARDRHAPEIYCVEAVSANIERLEHNIRLNGLEETIFTIGKGVGDVEKDVQIQIEGNLKDGQGTGTANILSEHSDHVAERVPLAMTTLDNLIEEGLLSSEVSLIKIDVDGYDLNVLKGARNTLSRSRPIIFGEFMEHCLAWHGQSYTDVIAYMRTLSYRVYRRMNERFIFSARDFENYSSDLLIVPEEKVEALGWCIER